MLLRHQNLGFKYSQLMKSMWIISSYTANNYHHFTANCGVTFLTVIWQYLELLMAVQHTPDYKDPQTTIKEEPWKDVGYRDQK